LLKPLLAQECVRTCFHQGFRERLGIASAILAKTHPFESCPGGAVGHSDRSFAMSVLRVTGAFPTKIMGIDLLTYLESRSFSDRQVVLRMPKSIGTHVQVDLSSHAYHLL